MFNKLKNVDLTKLSPAQRQKVAGALAKCAKKSKQTSKGTAAALKSIATAKSAVKSGKAAFIDIEED